MADSRLATGTQAAPWLGTPWITPPEEDDESFEVSGRAGVALGVHLVGSLPLAGAEEAFRRMASALGDRLRRMPDGETGPRADWILWQYPVFSSLPQFEVGPPGDGTYRTLPKLRLRAGESASSVTLDGLGYAETAIASYRLFATLKRDGVIPSHCRFQVSLPTPLAPVSAFVDPEFQAVIEPIYEVAMLTELAQILAAIPPEQLAIQWDARAEFAMLEGLAPAWFTEVRAGVLERLLRLARHVPSGVELGFHLCYGDDAHGHFVELHDSRKLVEIANALAASLSRPLNWVHMPAPHVEAEEYFAPLGALALRPETELYLGLLRLGESVDAAQARIAAAHRHVRGFGVATDCGWGRGGPDAVDGLLDLHRAVTEPLPASVRAAGAVEFAWPDGFVPVPDEDWTRQEIDATALAYDHVDEHGWYSNLNPTVDEIAGTVRDGDVVLDYSGGTGILLDRLRLRLFERPVGWLIVDASAKFLRVAIEKYQHDPLLGVRLLRFLKDQKRLQTLDEVLGEEMLTRGVDLIVAVNAIHLYPDLGAVAEAWVRALKPGGKVFINSGNLRNPRAAAGEWILDETVWVINDIAEGIVRSEPEYAKYRAVLDDTERMKAHATHRDRVFLKPRPLEYYTTALSNAGLTVTEVREKTIIADVHEWFELMTAYHESVLGWVGGTKKLDGEEPTEEGLKDRLTIMRRAMETIFAGRKTFNACWTYITCEQGVAE
jgi:SAM-dependent methyltransferase